MTRKNISTPDITAGITAAERLLSLAPRGAASAERAVLPFRLTQLVVTRFDMDVVDAAVFLNLGGTAPIQASQNADADFHVHLRRVIDRYRLDCLFVEDAPGPIPPRDQTARLRLFRRRRAPQGHGSVAR
jgi:hypothetical protein